MSSSQQHPASIKPYLLVFGALALLTSLTVGLSYMGLPHKTAILVAAAIALTKCSLIAAFFMHLRFENRKIYVILLAALFLVGLLILTLIPDIGLVK